ncbi:MAG: Mur ligase family protein [Salinivirgaceae bacterium]
MCAKNIHFIAIGGSAMHNLAIALHKQGHVVTGSDDEIFEPSRGRLKAHELLPTENGWHPEKITREIDTIILGMHAKPDNPELQKARELGIEIVSYPEFLYRQTANKTRVAIAGSHGKTTTTAMVMHVLKATGITFDYMVGASIDGFDTMVNFDKNSEIAIFEADEYLSSPIDMRSKFLWYKPHLSVITGIAWDHINVFPTFESYLQTFAQFLQTFPEKSKLFWYEKDEHLEKLIANIDSSKHQPYQGFTGKKTEHGTELSVDEKTFQVPIFGNHNLQNLNAAYYILKELGISTEQFAHAISSFKGAARRLQILKDAPSPIYYDFAHAPSKVKATVEAVKNQHPEKKILVILELHTFSSLNKAFLPQYANSLNEADLAYIYYNPHTLAHKNLPQLKKNMVKNSFKHPGSWVFTNSDELFRQASKQYNASEQVILIMTSGNFNGVDIKDWSAQLTS